MDFGYFGLMGYRERGTPPPGRLRTRRFVFEKPAQGVGDHRVEAHALPTGMKYRPAMQLAPGRTLKLPLRGTSGSRPSSSHRSR